MQRFAVCRLALLTASKKVGSLSNLALRDRVPVLFYIAGNTFNEGGKGWLDPSPLVSFGTLIVVTVQYRVGVFGWLSMLRAGLRGNLGLYDIECALKWVQDNIKFFGGNRELITVMGSGAGQKSCII